MTVDQWLYNCRQKCAVMSKCIHYRPPLQSISAEWSIDHTVLTRRDPQLLCLQSDLDHCHLLITERKSLAPLQMQSLQASYLLKGLICELVMSDSSMCETSHMVN